MLVSKKERADYAPVGKKKDKRERTFSGATQEQEPVIQMMFVIWYWDP